MIDPKDILRTEKWLNLKEIDENLDNVEYIISVSPTPGQDATLPIHFTIYLNTQDMLPTEVIEDVFNKFAKELEIFKVHDMIQGLYPVAFSLNGQENAMPMLILDNSDVESELETTKMYVFDFEGNAKGFKECKTESKSGWSYSYSESE